MRYRRTFIDDSAPGGYCAHYSGLRVAEKEGLKLDGLLPFSQGKKQPSFVSPAKEILLFGCARAARYQFVILECVCADDQLRRDDDRSVERPPNSDDKTGIRAPLPQPKQ